MKNNISYDFKDKVILITGGARGMGLDQAQAFVSCGAYVAIIDIGKNISSIPYAMSTSSDIDKAKEILCSQGGDKNKVLALRGSVTDPDFVSSAVNEIYEKWGKIDVLINNAGINSQASICDMSFETWNDVIGVNLTGAFLCCKYVGKVMIKARQGKIINIASGASFVGVPNQAHYVAAKHGIIGLTKSLCLELGSYNINVNAVAPSVVNTPHMQGLSKHYPDALPKMKELYGTFNPLSSCEILDTSDITKAVQWLASNESRFISGISLVIDAGFLAK